jgi:hypothetical protein
MLGAYSHPTSTLQLGCLGARYAQSERGGPVRKHARVERLRSVRPPNIRPHEDGKKGELSLPVHGLSGPEVGPGDGESHGAAPFTFPLWACAARLAPALTGAVTARMRKAPEIIR